ncbi:MAG: helix-turn-helix domain-containing protein [Chloroflexi bacterium]|nr:helix-turn-helix domain-containing protein [Chloroflexota bacterium]
MVDARGLEDKLRSLSEELRQRGEIDLVDDVEAIIGALHEPVDAKQPSDLLTTGEAARVLSVRSINTVKRWAFEGLLDGVRRGGRLMVTAQSVQRMLQSPTVADQRAREAQIAAALEPFDAGDETVPPTSGWQGHRPWERRGRADA